MSQLDQDLLALRVTLALVDCRVAFLDEKIRKAPTEGCAFVLLRSQLLEPTGLSWSGDCSQETKDRALLVLNSVALTLGVENLEFRFVSGDSWTNVECTWGNQSRWYPIHEASPSALNGISVAEALSTHLQDGLTRLATWS